MSTFAARFSPTDVRDSQAVTCNPRWGEFGLYNRMAPVPNDRPPTLQDDFDSLVRQHRPRIFRFLLASLRDRETAENLTQDCFVRAYQARDQFRGASSVATWFLQIAANLVRDHESSGRLKFWRRTLHASADVAEIAHSIPDQ